MDDPVCCKGNSVAIWISDLLQPSGLIAHQNRAIYIGELVAIGIDYVKTKVEQFVAHEKIICGVVKCLEGRKRSRLSSECKVALSQSRWNCIRGHSLDIELMVTTIRKSYQNTMSVAWAYSPFYAHAKD